MEVIIWLVVLAACILIELATLGLTTIWFAGGALLALIAAALSWDIWIQIVIFVVVSLVLLIFTRPIAEKHFNKKLARTNVESVIGKQVIVTERIDNLEGVGTVKLDGQEWSARAVDAESIEASELAEVVEVSGVKLMVKKIEK